MAESDYRQAVVKALQSVGMDPVSVENRVHPGTPDVNYLLGWIELKVLAGWPVRPETPLVCETFTKQQRIWLRRRWKAGGQAHLLVRVGREHLLLNGSDAADYFGIANRAVLEGVSIRLPRIEGTTLLEALKLR